MAAKFPVKMGEEVVVIAGRDKSRSGKTVSGKVTSINRTKMTITVEGVNIRKKAIRPSEENPNGGFQEFEAPIHVSNVMKKEKFDSKNSQKAE